MRIEKVIKTRTVKGKKESLVQWLGYGEKFNSWVATENIENNKI